MPFNENDPEGKRRYSAFTQALADLGWTDGHNVRMDLRWTGAAIDRIRALAHELVGLQPDIILTQTVPATVALQGETRTIPIVSVGALEPVASGVVSRLDRPGTITVVSYEATLGGKWLELLSEIAPGLKRAAIMFNPETAAGGGSYFLPSFEAAARSLKVVPINAPVHSDVEIETAIMDLGREPGGGLVVMPGVFTFAHRAPIISAAARNNVSAVYPNRAHARDGGLLSYGPDQIGTYRGGATYIDRILRGATLAELPVQLPTKFEMAVNLNTAKALGQTRPQSILLRADEVIE